MKKNCLLFFLSLFAQITLAQTSDVGVPKDYTGEWINWYGNRQVKEKINYVNGHREGKWIYYNSDGTIQTDAEYKKGKKFTSLFPLKEIHVSFTFPLG